MEKEQLAEFLNHYLSLATLIGGIVVLALVIFVIYLSAQAGKNVKGEKSKQLNCLAKNSLLIGFVVALFGSALTLFYSEYLGYVPCDLCWYQRIFLYPQIFIFGLALWKKDFSIHLYTLALSLIGLVIAIYHHMLQIGYDMYKPCSDALFAVDCAKPSFIEYGFVTFPFMAVVLFTFLAILSFVAIKFSKK